MRILKGKIVSKSGDKTVSVAVQRVVVHPIYHKRHTRTKKYLAHDPANTGEVGQEVSIQEAKPRSKRKRWLLLKAE